MMKMQRICRGKVGTMFYLIIARFSIAEREVEICPENEPEVENTRFLFFLELPKLTLLPKFTGFTVRFYCGIAIVIP